MRFGRRANSSASRPQGIRRPRVRRGRRVADRRGMLLVVVLLVIALLSLAGYSYSQYMFSEYRGATVSARLAQSRLFAESGVDAIKVFLMQDEATRDEAGGVYDNSGQFQSVLVRDDDSDRERGRFGVVAPLLDDDGAPSGIRFGLENESTRLNVNALIIADGYAPNGGRTLLMSLPGMTEDIADAILDFLDADEEPREFGCESEYYSSLSPAYACRNGPLMSIEELLLVRGVTPAMLFGADVNRNGIIDPSEESRASGMDTSEGSMAGGWASYLTLFSQEKNARSDGRPRINLNNSDLAALYDELTEVMPQEWADFIVLYRQNGPYRGTNMSGAAKPAIDTSLPAKFQLSQVLDLVGVRVQVLNEDMTRTVIESPFPNAPLLMGTFLPVLMDNCSVNPSPIIPGRININQAPRAILMGIPGMNEDILTELLSRRSPEATDDNPNRRYETWLLAEAICTLEEMKAMMPYITGGGSAFRAQVIGYFDQDGPASRIEAVFDATTAVPRIVFWRDISNLGPGYSSETLGIEVRN